MHLCDLHKCNMYHIERLCNILRISTMLWCHPWHSLRCILHTRSINLHDLFSTLEVEIDITAPPEGMEEDTAISGVALSKSDGIASRFRLSCSAPSHAFQLDWNLTAATFLLPVFQVLSFLDSWWSASEIDLDIFLGHFRRDRTTDLITESFLNALTCHVSHGFGNVGLLQLGAAPTLRQWKSLKIPVSRRDLYLRSLSTAKFVWAAPKL